MNYTKIKSARNENWIEVKFIVFWIDPIVHNLLGQGPATQPSNGSDMAQELTRIGLIIFLFKLRRVCGQLGVLTTFFVVKLKTFASTLAWKVLWNTSKPLLLWVLFFGMLESWGSPDEIWYVETTTMAAHWMGLRSWDATVRAVKEFPWLDGLFDAEFERFKGIFESILTKLDQNVLSP